MIRKSDVVDLSFSTVFGLEAVVFSSELWARLSVGIVLATVVLPIFW